MLSLELGDVPVQGSVQGLVSYSAQEVLRSKRVWRLQHPTSMEPLKIGLPGYRGEGY